LERNSIHSVRRWLASGTDSFGETPLARSFAREWLPSVDVSETKEDLVIRAELPGMHANDLDVSISGDLLTIKTEIYYQNQRYCASADPNINEIKLSNSKGDRL
jgi:HSP20 family molecular chaperone IbpA